MLRCLWTCAFVTCLALVPVASSGCAGPANVRVPIPEKWVDEVISQIVAWIEDGTGIDLEKGDVNIQSLGARKTASGSAHISDFKITVKYRQTEFTSTPKDIPCNTDGIPTEAGNARIKEAVEEIKTHIRASRK